MYNFKESQLGKDFAKDKLKDFKELIDSSISFVVMAMPGVGASFFLKYLCVQDFAYFIHVDAYELPNLSQHEFYKLLLFRLGEKPGKRSDEELLLRAKSILHPLAQKYDKIVIVFNRFDQLKTEFDWNFLSNIQSLTNLVPGKIIEIFTSVKPLHEIAPEAMKGGNLNFYSEELYFKPYSKEDLKELLSIEPTRPIPEETLEKMLELSGGHNQLLHILLSSQKKDLLSDQFVKMQMKELIGYLDYQQRKTLQKIALGKKVDPDKIGVDEYLLGVGMVKKVGSDYQLFTPLLTDYLKFYFSPKLPPKESKLFNILRKNIGKTTSKDEIFSSLWSDEADKATDWALDALIYRLRKHPFIKANGYAIESQKKVGYTLIQT